MFDSNGNLDIFDNFITDTDLPKHRPVLTDGVSGDVLGQGGVGFSMSRNQFRFRQANIVRAGAMNSAITISGSDINSLGTTLLQHRFTWLQNLVLRVLRWVSPSGAELVVRPLGEPDPVPTITVREFFSSIKNTIEDLGFVDGRVRGYEAAIERARNSGQVAMMEALEQGLQAARAETQLHTLGMTTVLAEATLVQFVKECPKGVRLDWIRNFTRHVPDEVLAKKCAADERHIFDNYVVLHYDPKGKSWAETHEEKAARKDPILFGVLEGKRQLYFVDEWVDELCDLSLDQIADVLSVECATVELDPESFDDPEPAKASSDG